MKAITKSTFTVPKLLHEPVELLAASFSTVSKPKQKQGIKRAHIPALLLPFLARSPAREEAAAQIALLKIRSIADLDRSPRHRVRFPAGLAKPTTTRRA